MSKLVCELVLLRECMRISVCDLLFESLVG